MDTLKADLLLERNAELEKELAAKNRELEIEAALERVRAAAMAMHKSDNLHAAVTIMFEEFQKLNLNVLRCGVGILNKDSRTGTVWATSVSDNGFAVQISANESFDTHPLMMLIYEYWQKQEDLSYVLQGEDLVTYYKAMEASELKLPKSQVPFSEDELKPQYYYAAMFNAGGLYAFRDEPFATEDIRIMKRFASIVNLTYNRFLDLQNAEARAREATIEAALERVRASAMAMHKSQEVIDVAIVMYKELQKLGYEGGGTIIIMNEETAATEHWTGISQDKYPKSCYVPYFKHPCNDIQLDAWKKGEKFLVYQLAGEEKKLYDNYFFTITGYKDFPAREKEWMQGLESVIFSFAFMKYGAILWGPKALTEEQSRILQRFAQVFEQTYRRFLDLQKAEAQAREAKIEASLERVRARAMAMHNSQDLTDTIGVFYKELHSFSLTPIRCGVGLLNKESRTAELFTWNTTEQGNSLELVGILKMEGHPVLEKVYENWITQVEYHPVLRGNEIKEYYQILRPQINFPDYRHDAVQYGNFFFFNEGGVYAWTENEMKQDELNIYRRFTSVLSLTYKRYKDLKQAESQAREAQIEAALERVRARTMAMHKSEEVMDVAGTLFEELQKLGFTFGASSIIIMDKQSGDAEYWIAGFTQNRFPESYYVKYFQHPYHDTLLSSWQNSEKFLVYTLAGEEKKSYDKVLFTETGYKNIPKQEQDLMRGIDSVTFSIAFMKHGALHWGPAPVTDEQATILQRFAYVFEQSYTRFLDLQKAEAQAREAQIEAALERIRAKALAMQTSSDLIDVANVLREQMGNLDQPDLESSIIHLYNDDAETFDAWYAYSPPNHSSGVITGSVNVRKDSSEWSREVITKYKSSETEYTIVSGGQKIKEWYKVLEELAPATVDYDGEGRIIVPEILYYHFSKFSGGALLMISNQDPSTESRELQKRAAAVFDLAYTRFNDLKQAEARAREAKTEAALDRVRAEIASMRTTGDLEKITPLIWNELNILGVPFVRCGVFIMDEQQQQMQTYLSTPEGKAIAAFRLPFESEGITQQVLSYWRKGQIFTELWDRTTFLEWANSLAEQGVLTSKESFLTEHPPHRLVLHFIPFAQGMLYVGNTSQLTADEIQLVKSLAETFAIAYARYEDFTQLENAKNKVEATLAELKVTQRQLIQSEKMASLGELTAGIAHEIQNPLNFVNNFSDVSAELVSEMQEALEKDDKNEVITLAAGIKENLKKINHHGKRADAIVKGMLQHSRASTGKKEPTDINALADEFLRLSYHGLRVKDNTFTATIDTRFEENLGRVEVAPQDIGRVLLNVYNNAFYAVNEKRKQLDGTYEPTVTVSTKRVGNKVEIAVKDNGSGIPQKALDKIFQPFFTTKPTGEGTGLGLSLSYDIIKAHGGELKVETKEGEGAEFIIELPVKEAGN